MPIPVNLNSFVNYFVFLCKYCFYLLFSLLLPFVFIILYPNYFSDPSSCICRKVYFELYHIPGYIKTISRTLIVSSVTVQPLAKLQQMMHRNG